MSEEETEQKHSRDEIFKSISHLKVIFGVFVMVHAAIAGGAVWIYKVDESGIQSREAIRDHGTRLTDIERRQIKSEAESFTAKEAATLTSEITGLKASISELYRTVQRIDSKLP